MQLAEVVKDASGVGSGIFGKELGAGGLLRPGLVLKTGLEESGLHGPEKTGKFSSNTEMQLAYYGAEIHAVTGIQQPVKDLS